MGATRFLSGLLQVVSGPEVTAIVNVAGAIDPERGWGLAGETWHAMEALGRFPKARAWFNLGDRDLATHLYRTDRLAAGAVLSEVARELADAWELTLLILPVTDDRVRTRVTVEGQGEIGFQEYFVDHQHGVAVSALRFDGVDRAQPAPGVLDALAAADGVRGSRDG